MQSANDLLSAANERAVQLGLTYSGALTPREAYEVLDGNPNAILVDVRTQAELDLVGRVPGAAHIEWAFYPGMTPNPEFANQLTARIDKNLTVIFMCRTGGRSHNAAVVAHQLGYLHVYNMLEGFEGEANQLKQRTLINGWRRAGLPWSN